MSMLSCAASLCKLIVATTATTTAHNEFPVAVHSPGGCRQRSTARRSLPDRDFTQGPSYLESMRYRQSFDLDPNHPEFICTGLQMHLPPTEDFTREYRNDGDSLVQLNVFHHVFDVTSS